MERRCRQGRPKVAAAYASARQRSPSRSTRLWGAPSADTRGWDVGGAATGPLAEHVFQVVGCNWLNHELRLIHLGVRGCLWRV
eukprot:15064209-Alexandrium_andersonii.AAC.1